MSFSIVPVKKQIQLSECEDLTGFYSTIHELDNILSRKQESKGKVFKGRRRVGQKPLLTKEKKRIVSGQVSFFPG